MELRRHLDDGHRATVEIILDWDPKDLKVWRVVVVGA